MSVLDLAGRSYGSLDRLPLSGISSLEPYDFTLDVSENNLTSLDCSESSPNAKVLSRVEILIAQQNDLRDLLNVQFAFPSLVVLDVSENSLETVALDDQGCLAEILGLDTLIASSNTMLNFALGTSWPSLKVIDLSSNDLRDIPNFGPFCPNLVTVMLNDNAIDSLQHIASRLPPYIEQLYLNNNAIDDWYRLAQLTAFAETLTTINMIGNDFCDRVKFSWKIFLAWLLPCAVEIDGAGISDHEKDAVNDLFRDAQNPNTNDFSVKLLGTMEEGRELELEAYLNVHCRVTVRPNHPRRISPTPSRHSYVDPTAANHLMNVSGASSSASRGGSRVRPSPQRRRLGSDERDNSGSQKEAVPRISSFEGPRQQLQQAPTSREKHSLIQMQEIQAAPKLPTQPASGTGGAAPGSSNGGGGGTSSAVAQAIQQLQTKVKVIQDVVKVLRQTDMAKRVRAATVIQKYYRGHLVRNRQLTQKDRKRLRELRVATIVGFRRPVQDTKTGIAEDSSRIAAEDTKVYSDKVERLAKQVDSLQRHIALVDDDLVLIRRMAFLEKERAARTIQTHYRGFVARRSFQVLKGAYKKFTAQYEAPATQIQSVVRMHLQRKRYRRQLEEHSEREALRSDNKMLKARVTAMEKAMAAILSRLETVEQLALLGAEADGLGRSAEDNNRYYSDMKYDDRNSQGMRQQQRGQASYDDYDESEPPSSAERVQRGDRNVRRGNREDSGEEVYHQQERRYHPPRDGSDGGTPTRVMNRRHHSPSP